jgi:hypothetical protein
VVLSKFTSLGTVLSKYPSLSEINNGTNWIALEYKSHLEAEKASCQNNSILDLGNGQVVVLGVVPVNEQLALSLKLKNFMELGSTGVERIAMGDGIYEIDDTNNNGDKSGKRKLTAETRVWNEDDVLYKGDDVGKVGKGMRENEDMDDNASMPKNEICDKFMKWVFSWKCDPLQIDYGLVVSNQDLALYPHDNSKSRHLQYATLHYVCFYII